MIISHSRLAGEEKGGERRDFCVFSPYSLGCFCISQLCVTGDLLLMNQGESTGSGPNSWHCFTTCRACRCKKTFFSLVILHPKMLAQQRHTCSAAEKKKKGWIRRNKLPVDVVEASVNHSQLN